jgi:predicted nucleic acid-binding protein
LRVVDASVLCGVVTREVEALAAIRAAGADDPADDLFHCPAIVEAEALNALRGMERGGLLSRDEAHRAAVALGEVRMVLYAFGDVRDRVWELRHNLSIYDATYVALAERLDGSVLLTADRGLATVARPALGDARVQLVS